MEAPVGPTPMALRRRTRCRSPKADAGGRRLRASPPAARPRHGRRGRASEQPQRDPGRVKFSIDLRNASDAICDAMDADYPRRRGASPLRRAFRTPIERRSSRLTPAQPFHPDRIGAAARRPPGLLEHARRLRRRYAGTWRLRAVGDDLHPVQGRHQPQRDRGRPARAISLLAATCCCTRCFRARWGRLRLPAASTPTLAPVARLVPASSRSSERSPARRKLRPPRLRRRGRPPTPQTGPAAAGSWPPFLERGLVNGLTM